VPMLTCGLVRSNFAFATVVLLSDGWCGAAVLGAAVMPGVAPAVTRREPS
jgi:hypothetical protein